MECGKGNSCLLTGHTFHHTLTHQQLLGMAARRGKCRRQALGILTMNTNWPKLHTNTNQRVSVSLASQSQPPDHCHVHVVNLSLNISDVSCHGNNMLFLLHVTWPSFTQNL